MPKMTRMIVIDEFSKYWERSQIGYRFYNKRLNRENKR
jgi:hypothetical protein